MSLTFLLVRDSRMFLRVQTDPFVEGRGITSFLHVARDQIIPVSMQFPKGALCASIPAS